MEKAPITGRRTFINALLGYLALATQPLSKAYSQWRGGTPSHRKVRNKKGQPRGYSGAKLARKALAKSLTVRHMGGLGVINRG